MKHLCFKYAPIRPRFRLYKFLESITYLNRKSREEGPSGWWTGSVRLTTLGWALGDKCGWQVSHTLKCARSPDATR